MAAPTAATVPATAVAAAAGEKEARREEEAGLTGLPGGGNDENGKRSDTMAYWLTVEYWSQPGCIPTIQ